jgi:NADPH:quinone reductase-like Zn-dependent oxidoreductase
LAPAVTGFEVGDRVAAWTEGRGYAEEVAVKAETLSLISDDIGYEHALI